MSDWTELKRLSESVPDNYSNETAQYVIFSDAADPQAILALIAENEALRAANIDSVDWVNSAKAYIERLEADNRSKNGSMKAFGEQIAKLQRAVKNRDKQLDKLRAEVEVLRKDAERYRWLRDSEELGGFVFSSVNEWLWGGGDFQDVSAAIDAAMSKGQSNG